MSLRLSRAIESEIASKHGLRSGVMIFDNATMNMFLDYPVAGAWIYCEVSDGKRTIKGTLNVSEELITTDAAIGVIVDFILGKWTQEDK